MYGDHAVCCGIGGHLFTRHGAIHAVIADAGRAAGYTVYSEQVIPELCQIVKNAAGVTSIQEPHVDVEIFGHHCAPDCLIDGAIRHLAVVLMCPELLKKLVIQQKKESARRISGIRLLMVS